MSESLPFFDDSDVKRVLCVAAHPDDLEYGASAVVAKWTASGVSVSYLLVTSGEAGMPSHHPEKAGPLRREEQKTACAAVGVDDLEFLDFADGTLEHSPALRKAIAKRIREFRPDTVITQDWSLQVPWGLNHVDHRVTGLATVDAIRDADNTWVFHELAAAGLEKHSTKRLLTFGSSATHLIDVSGEPFEKGVQSLAAHRRYFDDIVDDFDPRVMFEQFTSGSAEQVADENVTHAMSVAVYQMG